jgi:pimeloyl-ACP methyl ester carboxylesterase
MAGMSKGPALLVLHGITMSGASMLRSLGPLRTRLEAAGFDLIAPNAAHAMTSHEVASLVQGVRASYTQLGQDAGEWFCDGKFWDAGDHFDWFGSATDADTGLKHYHALERSLTAVADAIRDRDVAGVLGFSQGAAMAIILAALACQGDARFAELRFGVFMSGFKPVFAVPPLVSYPIRAPFPGLFVIGDRDPLMTGKMDGLIAMASAFDGSEQELILVPGLEHDVCTDAQVVDQVTAFASAIIDP